MAVLNSYLDYPVPTKIDFISRCWLGKLFAVSKKLASFKIKFLGQWWLTPQVNSFLTSICLVEHPELLILAERNASIFVQWEFPSQRSLNLKIILWLSFLSHEAYTYIYIYFTMWGIKILRRTSSMRVIRQNAAGIAMSFNWYLWQTVRHVISIENFSFSPDRGYLNSWTTSPYFIHDEMRHTSQLSRKFYWSS